MAKRKYNLSPKGRAALLKTVRKMNADPAAKAERIRQQMADPEFQRRREEAFRQAVKDPKRGVGRPRKNPSTGEVADSVR
jgi:hypothetical protein